MTEIAMSGMWEQMATLFMCVWNQYCSVGSGRGVWDEQVGVSGVYEHVC